MRQAIFAALLLAACHRGEGDSTPEAESDDCAPDDADCCCPAMVIVSAIRPAR